MLLQFRRRDRHRLQASFRRGTSYPFWRLGFRQSSFRHITRIFPARRPVRLSTAAGFLACYCPLHLSDLGSAIRSRDISSHLCPLRGRYNTAPRGAAAAKYSNPSAQPPALCDRGQAEQPAEVATDLGHADVLHPDRFLGARACCVPDKRVRTGTRRALADNRGWRLTCNAPVTGSELGGGVVLVLGDVGQANSVRRFRQRERQTRRSTR